MDGGERIAGRAADPAQGFRPVGAIGASPSWIAIGALIAVAVVAAAIKFGRFGAAPAPGPSVSRSVRFVVTPPPNAAFSPSSASFALSPDGRALAFTASAAQSGLALWLQSLDSLEAKRVTGTEGAGQIFWSPDSGSIAFADTTAQFRPKRVDLASGVVRSYAGAEINGVGAWSAEHGIIANYRGVIQQMREDGGAPTPLTVLDAAAGETSHIFPAFIPNGRSFMFLAQEHEARK